MFRIDLSTTPNYRITKPALSGIPNTHLVHNHMVLRLIAKLAVAGKVIEILAPRGRIFSI